MVKWLKSLFCKHHYIPDYYGICKIGYSCAYSGKRVYHDRNRRHDGQVLEDALNEILEDS